MEVRVFISFRDMACFPKACSLMTVPLRMRFSYVQSLSCVRLFATPWTAACQASLAITHPYDVNIKGETGINAKQMAIIEKEFANKGTSSQGYGFSSSYVWM